MKLRLETQDNATILVVTERVTSEHVPVLKAGLTKIFASGRKLVIVDLGPLKIVDFESFEIAQEISTLQAWASGFDAQVAIVSTIPGVGQATNRGDALRLLNSKMGKLFALEAKLKLRAEELGRQKLILERRLMSSTATGAADLKTLRKENTMLKALVTDLETQIQQFLNGRTQPAQADSIEKQKQDTEHVLVAILEQEGVIPVV